MRPSTILCGIALLLLVVACGRPTVGEWSADDSQRAAASLADSLLASRWTEDWEDAAAPAIALVPLEVELAGEVVDPEIYGAELRRRLVSAGLRVSADPEAADFALRSTLRRAQDDYGDHLYLLEATLVARTDSSVAWADSVQVRKGRRSSSAQHGGGKSLAHDHRQPGDRLGSYPENKATNRTVNLHVTKQDLSESQLLADLAQLRRMDGVRSIQETMDERGSARLLVYVLPHRELEVRQRLVEMGWEPVRY